MSRPGHSPWGSIQGCESLCDGVWWIDTAGHGGCYVEDHVLDRIPPVFRAATFTGSANWYEEDVDWAIVAKFIPGAFPAKKDQDAAEKTLRIYHKAPYQAHFGTQPDANEVHEAHRSDLVQQEES